MGWGVALKCDWYGMGWDLDGKGHGMGSKFWKGHGMGSGFG
jgi:hypothetical protein